MELHWKSRVMPRHSEFENTTQLVGFLPTDPGTTLFTIFTEGDLYGLRGAFVPDVDESYGFESEYNARHAAQDYMNAWIEKNVTPLPPMWILENGTAKLADDLEQEVKPPITRDSDQDIEKHGPGFATSVHSTEGSFLGILTFEEFEADLANRKPAKNATKSPHTLDLMNIRRADALLAQLEKALPIQTLSRCAIVRKVRIRLRLMDAAYDLQELGLAKELTFDPNAPVTLGKKSRSDVIIDTLIREAAHHLVSKAPKA